MTENDFQQQVLERLDKIETDLRGDISGLKQEVERSNERFGNYQQAVQWVVQLAFTLIASATVTVIVSAVFKR